MICSEFNCFLLLSADLILGVSVTASSLAGHKSAMGFFFLFFLISFLAFSIARSQLLLDLYPHREAVFFGEKFNKRDTDSASNSHPVNLFFIDCDCLVCFGLIS